MIGLLWRLLIGRFASCEHQWAKRNSLEMYDNDTGDGLPTAIQKHLQCTKCGNFKAVRL